MRGKNIVFQRGGLWAMPQEKKEYVAPEIEKREKLGEVAGMPTVSTVE
jgi:hypothetical protein